MPEVIWVRAVKKSVANCEWKVELSVAQKRALGDIPSSCSVQARKRQRTDHGMYINDQEMIMDACKVETYQRNSSCSHLSCQLQRIVPIRRAIVKS